MCVYLLESFVLSAGYGCIPMSIYLTLVRGPLGAWKAIVDLNDAE